MKSDLIEKSFECLKNIKFNDATKEIARDVILNEYYLTLKDNNVLQQRIDKAIQYIEEHKRNVYDTFGEGIVFGEMGGIKEILDILRGKDGDE